MFSSVQFCCFFPPLWIKLLKVLWFPQMSVNYRLFAADGQMVIGKEAASVKCEGQAGAMRLYK